MTAPDHAPAPGHRPTSAVTGPLTLEEVVAREIELLDPHMRQDGAALQALLHPDFVELSPTGHVYDRDSVLEPTAADTTHGMTIEQVAAQEIVPGTVLVTYRSHRGERVALRSSLWLWSDGRWLLRHHQGTPVRGAYPV